MAPRRPATLGHVIMFGAVAAGWSVLFVLTLLSYQPTPRWWALAVFSALAAVVAVVVALVLNRRRAR
jgi:hypothetical protein